MTQNQASLRWKKPGFEQKFLMQGEKQVPAASGCRRFYGDSNINFHLYAYAGNSPVRYTDPDGKKIRKANTKYNQNSKGISNMMLGGNSSTETIGSAGCVLTMYSRIVSTLSGSSISPLDANKYANNNNLFSGSEENELTIDAGIQLINGLLKEKGILGIAVSLEASIIGAPGEIDNLLQKYDNDNFNDYFANARITTTNADGSKTYKHSLNVSNNPVRPDGFAPSTNIYFDDTSGVRTKLRNDIRNNELIRIDILKVNKTLETGE